MKRVNLALGIDPDTGDADAFLQMISRHSTFLESADVPHAHWLKPNLSFFLRHGAKGIAALEDFVTRHRGNRRILLDCKLSEIENSLKASLTFAFETLGVHAVTLNPFLGERGIRLALEMAARSSAEKARVYVLCRTSEASEGALASLQSHWQDIAVTTARLAREVAAGDRSLALLGGVVVGAGRTDILGSNVLAEAGLSVLAPGLGAQGAPWENVGLAARSQLAEVVFPLSRAVFAGGVASIPDMKANLDKTLEAFKAQGAAP